MNGNTNTNPFVSYPKREDINPFHQIPADETNQQPEETNPFLQTPMNTTTPEPSQPAQYPSVSHQTTNDTNPFHQPIPSQQSQRKPESPPISAPATQKESDQTSHHTPSKSEDKQQADDHHHIQEDKLAAAGPSCSSPWPPAYDESAEKWGTQVMGHPAVPTCHPGNKEAALWGAPSDEAHQLLYPYHQNSPNEKSNSSSGQSKLHGFNSWSNKAESLANNIWQNLKTGPSVSGAAWAKMNLTAKAITGGGYESLYKQTFATYPNEKLKKTFASYLSTSTGPVAGTLYLSDVHVAFCSDRPLSFTAPSGQHSWSYYKVMVPLPNVGTINPVVMRENPMEKYIHIVTIDGQDFWFTGFVNYEKASRHLTESISSFVASGYAVQPAVEKHKE